MFGSYLTQMIFSSQDKDMSQEVSTKYLNNSLITTKRQTHGVTQGFAYACTHQHVRAQMYKDTTRVNGAIYLCSKLHNLIQTKMSISQNCCLDGLDILDVKLLEHVFEIPIERSKISIQATLIKVLGLTYEHAYLELLDSNPIRNFNSPIMDISIPFHHDPTKLHALGVCCCMRASSFSSKSCFGTS